MKISPASMHLFAKVEFSLSYVALAKTQCFLSIKIYKSVSRMYANAAMLLSHCYNLFTVQVGS